MAVKRIEEPPVSKGGFKLTEIVRSIQREILEQREEILTAFIAKYGVGPDECIQVIDYSRLQEGILSWRVEIKRK